MGAVAAAALVAATVMLTLDLLFLGVVAKEFYNSALGPLRSAEVYWPAAIAFYVFYVAFIVGVAILPAQTTKSATLRGAGLGLFAYGVYELTNWAVITDWPGALVPVDIAWGVVLTSSVAASGFLASRRLRGVEAQEW